MIQITRAVAFDERDITERFVRAIGPGGQNARKEATAVELRVDIGKASLLPDVKERLMSLGGRHVTTDGVLVVVSGASRSQAENRDTADPPGRAPEACGRAAEDTQGDEARPVHPQGETGLETAAQRAQTFAERARRGLAARFASDTQPALSTRRVLAFAPQLSLLPFLLAMLAAVLAVFPTLRHHAVARRMRTFLSVCHDTHLLARVYPRFRDWPPEIATGDTWICIETHNGRQVWLLRLENVAKTAS